MYRRTAPSEKENPGLYETCPKCEYRRQSADTAPNTECPACGLIFSKWMSRQFARDEPEEITESFTEGWFAWWRQKLFYVEPNENVVIFWCRIGVWVGFSVWGVWFMLTEYDKVIEGLPEINYSFMHSVDLVFHEAGHVMFMLLGRFMSILGGSLGQLIMPALVLWAFLFKYRNTFGASIALWWLAQSTMDLAPYINDAYTQQIILLGGGTGRDRPGYHDWNNILGDLGCLGAAHSVAHFVDLVGTLLLLLAIAWGGYLLYRQWGNLDRRL